MTNKKFFNLPRIFSFTGNEVVPLATEATNPSADLNAISAWFNAKPNAYNFGALSYEPVASPFDGGPIPLGAQYYNTTTGLLRTFGISGWFTPNINAQTLAGTAGSSLVGFIQNSVNANADTVQYELRATVRLSQFKNVDPTGVADSTLGVASAIACVKVLGGGVLDLGMGTFLLNGIAGADGKLNGLLVPNLGGNPNSASGRVKIVGRGKSTILKAGSNNMVLARISDSHGGISSVTFDVNGKTGVWMLGLIPEDIAQTSTVVYQIYNNCTDFYVFGGDEGIVMQCGPRIAGTDSGCWYNSISKYQIFGSKRAVWMRSGPNANSSGVNANSFDSGRHGQGMNTSIQIDAGSGNVFNAVRNEGVNTGASPNAIPTAVKIANVDAWGAGNNSNQFYAMRNESCTRQLDNQNARVFIFGGEWDASLFNGVKPAVMLGGDPSLMPVVIPGMSYSEGVPGYPASGYWGMTKDVVDVGFPWVDWSITFASGNLSGVTSASSVQSKFRKQGDMVDWHFVLKFAASAAGSEILITPPIFPNTSLYTNTDGRNAFYTFAVEDGTGVRKVVEVGWTNSTRRLYIKSPGSWNTGGDNNGIYGIVRYHA